MGPSELKPWEVYAGDDTSRLFVFTRYGRAQSLDGWDAWRATWRGGGEPVELPVDVDAAEGTVRVRIPGSMSDADAGEIRSGVWDLEAKRSGQTRTFVRGQIVWTEDVTR